MSANTAKPSQAKNRNKSGNKKAPKAADAPPVEKPQSAKDRKQEFQAEVQRVHALLGDLHKLRKSGAKGLTSEAAEILARALENGGTLKRWEAKGCTAFQVSGRVAPLVLPDESTPRDKAVAVALNKSLADFIGFPLRIVRYGSAKGVSYSAFLALTGR